MNVFWETFFRGGREVMKLFVRHVRESFIRRVKFFWVMLGDCHCNPLGF